MRCLFEFHIRPSEYIEMDENEKAFLIASIQIKDREEEKEMKKAER